MISALTKTTTKRGRKPRPHICTWNNEPVHGLYKCPDGRWRIVATGERFTEPDERLAVAKFRQWQREQEKSDMVLPVASVPAGGDYRPALQRAGKQKIQMVMPELGDWNGNVAVTRTIPEGEIWAWLREQLLKRPEIVAERVGIPQLANLADMDIPRDSIRLTTLMNAYKEHAACRPVTKRKVEKTWNELVQMTGAKTLRDLSTQKFLAYADAVRAAGLAAETIDNKFTRVKTVIGFGLKRGLDAAEIRGALDRAKVLVPPRCRAEYKPSPITPEDLHALLKAAKGDDLMTAALLLSLNACLYASEVLAVDWDEIDLKAGTMVTHREKTGIIRVAALWPRTVAALKKLKQTPGAIFKSARGDRYHPNSFRKLFAKLRTAAKVPATVEYNNLRDGAYTSACTAGVDFHLARILAGHRAEGQVDNYVARRPKMVQPATDAIERHYFPRG